MAKTKADLQEVLDKWRNDEHPAPKTVLQVEEVLTWYYGRGGYVKADVEMARSLGLAEVKKSKSKKKAKKKKKRELPSSIEDVLNLPDVEKMNGGCFFGLTKMFENKAIRFTFYLDGKKNSSRKLRKPLFVPPDTQPSSIEFLNIDPEPTIDSVYNSLIEKYMKYLFFIDDGVFNILVLAAMSTYFREVFNTYPYIDFFSPEIETGKTTAMLCVVWSCFYGLPMVNPTSAVIFRAIDSCKSVIGIDELDNIIQDPESGSRIQGLLNSAYQKGLPAYRIDTEQQMLPIPYDPFGLKVLTHIKAIPPSMSSRSIVINMVRSAVALPLLTNADTFREERDMLYNLRLNILDKVKTTYEQLLNDEKLGLSNRDIQKFTPLLTIAKLVSDDCYDKTHKWALGYAENHKAHSVDELMRTLIEAVVTLEDNTGDVVLKRITDMFNSLCVERELIALNKEGNPRNFGSKRVLRMLSTVGILKSDKRTNNKVHVLIHAKMIHYWAKSYGIEYTPPDDNLDNNDNLDNPFEEVTQVIQSTQVIVPTEATSFVPEAFINPKDPHIPQILTRLVKLWGKYNTAYDKGIQTTDTREYNILLVGVEAGYVTNRMPGNRWYLTPTAQKDIRSYGL